MSKRNKIAEQILKDCFWGDYSLKKEDILRIVESGNEWEKNFLFKKILYNSTKTTLLMKIFKENDLKKMLESYCSGNFRRGYIEKKIKVLKKNIFNIEEEIEELKWI